MPQAVAARWGGYEFVLVGSGDDAVAVGQQLTALDDEAGQRLSPSLGPSTTPPASKASSASAWSESSTDLRSSCGKSADLVKPDEDLTTGVGRGTATK
ncbi:MAG TPA: hypothetical protein VME46_14270 [Acidimicrobiales bacterium]|nr:hypothetical protein [Acidimicrobiales bacterium]